MLERPALRALLCVPLFACVSSDDPPLTPADGAPPDVSVDLYRPDAQPEADPQALPDVPKGPDVDVRPDVTEAGGGCQGTPRTCLDEKTAQSCSDGGLVPMPCPFVCVDGSCAGECNPSEKVCDGARLRVCTAEYAWSVKTCGTTCANGECATCTFGETRCSATSPLQLEKCTADGIWDTTEICTLACVTGSATAAACARDCVPGKTTCVDDRTRGVCNKDGTWRSKTACSGLCVTDRCVGECVPGDTRCKARTRQSCGTDGYWKDTETCPLVCSPDKCTDPTPTLQCDFRAPTVRKTLATGIKLVSKPQIGVDGDMVFVYYFDDNTNALSGKMLDTANLGKSPAVLQLPLNGRPYDLETVGKHPMLLVRHEKNGTSTLSSTALSLIEMDGSNVTNPVASTYALSPDFTANGIPASGQDRMYASFRQVSSGSVYYAVSHYYSLKDTYYLRAGVTDVLGGATPKIFSTVTSTTSQRLIPQGALVEKSKYVYLFDLFATGQPSTIGWIHALPESGSFTQADVSSRPLTVPLAIPLSAWAPAASTSTVGLGLTISTTSARLYGGQLDNLGQYEVDALPLFYQAYASDQIPLYHYRTHYFQDKGVTNAVQYGISAARRGVIVIWGDQAGAMHAIRAGGVQSVAPTGWQDVLLGDLEPTHVALSSRASTVASVVRELHLVWAVSDGAGGNKLYYDVLDCK